MRHKWGEYQRTYGSRRTQCLRCGMERDQRFIHNHHWNEYRKSPDGKWFIADKTPPCEAFEPKHDCDDMTEIGEKIEDAIKLAEGK